MLLYYIAFMSLAKGIPVSKPKKYRMAEFEGIETFSNQKKTDTIHRKIYSRISEIIISFIYKN